VASAIPRQADIQEDADIVRLADGGFTVVWSSARQDGSGKGIFGRRFSP